MKGHFIGAAFVLSSALAAANAQAQPPETAADAGNHFRHGVDLYSEANYAGALVEFKRAFALAPTAAALYDIGEAQFQLQNYAEALKTFRRFLVSYGPNEIHRAEVESNIQILGSRVGVVRIATTPPGADIAIDDEASGKTPFDAAVLVSVGRRKIVASMPGRVAVTRYVDVATGDDVAVSLDLQPEITPPPSSLAPQEFGHPSGPLVAPATANTPTLRAVGWISASALAVGAITFGVAAASEADALARARSGLTTSGTLEHDANLTTTFALVADALGVAALLTGGATLYLTVAAPDRAPSTRWGRITLGPASALYETTF